MKAIYMIKLDRSSNTRHAMLTTARRMALITAARLPRQRRQRRQ